MKGLKFSLFIFSLFLVETVYAQGTNDYLKDIDENTSRLQSTTTNAFTDNNNTVPDTGAGIIANNQGVFAQLYNDYLTDDTSRIGFSNTITQAYMGLGAPPNIGQNQFSYATLTNQALPFQPSSGSIGANAKTGYATQYLNNVAGGSLYLQPAPNTWSNMTPAVQSYTALYNTSAAIASYDAYIIGNLQTTNTQNADRNTLMSQASANDWFTHVGTENIGLVLRQLLMYTSQMYVQLDRLIKLQQEQETLMAMNNTLLIMSAAYGPGTGLYQQAQQSQNQS